MNKIVGVKNSFGNVYLLRSGPTKTKILVNMNEI